MVAIGHVSIGPLCVEGMGRHIRMHIRDWQL